MNKSTKISLNKIHQGDCLSVLRSFPDNCIDTIIADPPYGLSNEPDVVEVLTHWLAGDDYKHQGGGFMGMKWDSFVPGPHIWRECLRVLKPGGTSLVFGGTRTHDLLTIALRMAGFEIKDCIIAWLFGSGFPKSLNIGKAIDRSKGKEREDAITGGHLRYGVLNQANHKANVLDKSTPHIIGKGRLTTGTPATPEAAEWEGYGTGLSPAWEPIIVAIKPREGRFSDNALKYGVAGYWIDGARISTKNDLNGGAYRGKRTSGPGLVFGSLNEAADGEYIQPSGRWPANVLFEHHPGCVNRGVKRVKGDGHWTHKREIGGKGTYGGGGYEDVDQGNKLATDGKEEVADWQCVEGCPIKTLDEQSGVLAACGGPMKSSVGQPMNNNIYGKGLRNVKQKIWGQSGGASRFFYCAKSSKSERNKGCDNLYWRLDKSSPAGIVAIDRATWEALPEGERTRGNVHPTVKPVNFLTYISKLTRPPKGGIVLDPFAGSCSTALAAIRTGRKYIMIERESEYVVIGQAQIDEENKQPFLLGIFD